MARSAPFRLVPVALAATTTLVGLSGLVAAQEQSSDPAREEAAVPAPAAASPAAPPVARPALPAVSPPTRSATPPSPPSPGSAATSRLRPQPAPPLRPAPAQGRDEPPARFDRSLDSLVRDGIVTPAERDRLRSGVRSTPFNVPAHQQACRSGALSSQECSSGLVVRWRGRPGQTSGGLDPAAGGPLAFAGAPITTPLTVPVSALLAGSGANFRLSDVFAVTPRPGPVAGNGNRRLLFPLIGSAVTSSVFGYRLHPLLGSWLMHAGRDLAAPEGTPVVAALGGHVVSSGLAGGYGLAIEIDHDRPRRRTLYGHLSELYVKPGDRVRQGEVIGRVGSTGLSTGPHLHFELRVPGDGGWLAVDPGDLDPGQGALGSDAIALLMGQLLESLERPRPAAG
ncbi:MULTISPECIES: M23 family metallopeptidase [Aphanothece]|uniref:M23 family metallopeptidase n=1 Tax=Aphanothece TaxID=1121 RepID=UPI0039846370